MLIRKETPKDYEDIYKIVKKAFASAEHADGNEQDLVNALRTSKAYIPDLSLVADADGKIVGHKIGLCAGGGIWNTSAHRSPTRKLYGLSIE